MAYENVTNINEITIFGMADWTVTTVCGSIFIRNMIMKAKVIVASTNKPKATFLDALHIS